MAAAKQDAYRIEIKKRRATARSSSGQFATRTEIPQIVGIAKGSGAPTLAKLVEKAIAKQGIATVQKVTVEFVGEVGV